MLFLKQVGAEHKPVYALFRLGVILGIQVLSFVGGMFLLGHPPDSFAEITQSTSTDGITLQFTLPELTISEVTRDNIRYQEVNYADCHFTDEPGNPKIPVTRLMLGIPAAATIEAVDVSATPAETRNGVRLVPVPIFDIHELDSQHSASQHWSESGSAYLKKNGSLVSGNRSYPGHPLARVVREGYIRSQRVIALALYPVQYLPNTRQLRLYSRFTVNIRFSYTKQKGPLTAQGSGSQIFPEQRITVQESEAFERAFSHQLFNAEQAAHFRAPRPLVPAAPTLIPNGGNGTRYKLFIQETGIYAVTAASLQNDWGVDLIGTHPARLRLTQGNRDIPVYISGAADGSFDPNDAIFFLGHKPENRYSRWNVYWLTLDNSGRVPARVPQVTASPTDQTATQVPTFRSKVNFEEDYLTSNLEFVHTETVSPGDKHGWFDALDFWYWDGIKNGGDSAEMRLEFPLYDVAKSFDPPHISVDLQGGTPVSHEILVAINGVRIDFAKWEQQDTLTVGRTLRTWDTLKDSVKGEHNVLSLARVDSNVDEDTTRYPYHVYLNRFSVEYTRLFRAVAEELWFRSPTPDPTSREQFPGARKLQYKIEAFRDPGIHIFETDGTHLTARMQGVNVEVDVGAVSNRDSYNALFQVLDTRSTEFIAVSNTALRQPDHIDIVATTDLATGVHGADYLIVTHSNFLSPVQRLAAWRATPGGGGYRTKVVTTDDIYNTFGDGGVSSKAIKAFLKHAYQTWTPPAPTYVVLFGDGTFDFRGIDTDIYAEPPELTGYIPTHYIRTDSFGRTAADHWYATVSGHDEFTDFYIGRISIENINQADAVVDKIISYEQAPPNGDWRRRIISVADDEVSNSGDFIFKKSLDEIAKDHTRLGYETVEVFLEDVIDQVEAHPADYPGLLPQRVAKDKIIDALGEGAVLAQYAGHGGRIVWAHEAIFDNASVDQVEETAKIPFMLVLSCYNGYFDKPGEPSMAEKLLRKEKGGIIGMLSATRLTYGSGNDALNRIIFDMLFKRNIRQLGPLSFDSKVELLMTEGTGQIDVMMEYTLFGDPALQIAIANGEIQPAVETKTVAPGDTLRIASGHVQSATYDATSRKKRFVTDTDFNGTLTIKALFPGKTAIAQGVAGPVRYYTGDVVLTKTVNVNRGAYPAVTFSVPKNIASGDAHVEYHAQSNSTVAVGGDGFTVNIPKILDVKPELVDEDKFSISIQVSDEKEELFLVLLEWRNPASREWEKVRLVPADPPLSEDGWWTVPEPLNAPTDGSAIRYDLQVTDTDNNTVTSGRLQYYPYVYPNLSIVKVNRTAKIGYGYNTKTNQWYLSADVQMEGESKNTPIEVAFFSGNPDVDDDTLVDDDANLIGTTRIQPNDWVQRTPLVNPGVKKDVYEPDPLNTLPIATATLNLPSGYNGGQLPLGTHDIFVYIDVTKTEADQPGNVLENDEDDNIAYQRLFVDMGVAETASSSQISSLDRNCVITVPPGAFGNRQEATVLTVRALDEGMFAAVGASSSDTTTKPSPKGMSTRVPLPGVSAHGYEIIVVGDHRDEGTSPLQNRESITDASVKLTSPVAIDLNFDIGALRNQLTRELLGGTESEETPLEEGPDDLTVATTIDTAIASRAREFGIYMFNSTLGNWTRLPSQQLIDTTGVLQQRIRVTNVNEENLGESVLRDVRIQSEGARVGKYVLFFTGPQTYRLFLASPTVDDTLAFESLEVISSAEQLGNFSTDIPNFRHGFSLNVELDFEKPFAFGDILTFNITSLTQPVDVEADFDTSQQEQRWYASGFRDSNRGTGTLSYIELSTDTDMPEDKWIIFFLTDTEFQVEGEKTGILRSQTDGNQPLRGTVEEPFYYESYGLRFQLTQGERSFAPGDRFRFQTRPVGTIRATTERLGPVTLFYTDDTVPPDIQLTVGNQQHFVPGDATDAEPLIGATLTDPSGLDYLTRPLLLEIGDAFGEYERINPEAYQVTHHPGSNQLVLTYPSPELEPREYEVRLTASDVHGNTDTTDITFRVHDTLQLLSFLNYPNPFPRKTTLTCELTAPADSLVVKIYTLSGRLIRELSVPATPGFLMVEWDGRDADGIEVANGVYYAKLRVQREGEKDITEILKMMKLR